MFIYNVTIKVNWSIHDSWVSWMVNEHMPDVQNTGCFTGTRLLRLMEQDEADGPTYSAQYLSASKSDYDRYMDEHAARLRQKAFDKWGDQFIAFRSLMQVIA